MKQPILVQKYGGSSVADPSRLKHVARRVVAAKERGFRVVVVVSAMGDSTDNLMELSRQMTEHPPRRELDMLLSAGERISMSLLSMAIDALGHQAISFTGSQSGILTNDRHFDARIIEVRPVRIQDELERDKIVIVAGFQGMSYKREITTLGRGGSDTTAVALAAALDAEACEIYSDVDGVYNADPRIVDAATLQETLSYDEMEQMARCGARVLHAEAIALARKNGIALYARGTTSQSKGSLIRKDRDTQMMLVRPPMLAARDDLRSARFCLQTHEHVRLTALLKELELPPLWMFWEGERVELLFSKEDLPQLNACEEQLTSCTSEPTVWRDVAAVSLIRDAIEREPIWLDASVQTLQMESDVEIHRMDGGPSRLTFIVDPHVSQCVQQKLYAMIQSVSHTWEDV